MALGGTRLQRLAAGTLLNASTVTNRAISDALSDGIDEVAAELARKREDQRQRRAALIALLLMLSPSLAAKVRAAIVEGRQNARRAAIRRLVAELKAAGINVTAEDLGLGSTRPLIVGAGMNRAQDDDVHAGSASESLVTQWRGVALATALIAIRKDDDVVRAISKSKGLMSSRIDRTASTETAHAYDDTHRTAIEDAMAYDDALERSVTAVHLVRQWVAFLDACRFCWPYHGTTTEIGQNFEDGAEPGDMHIRCRCTDILVPMADALLEAA